MGTRRVQDDSLRPYDVVHHSDRGGQGVFNWSSQHLVITEVLDDGSSTAGSGSGDSSELAETSISAEPDDFKEAVDG